MATSTEKKSDLNDKMLSSLTLDELMHLVILEMIKRYRVDTAILLATAETNAATCWAGAAATFPDLLLDGLPASIESNDLLARAFKTSKVQVAKEPGLTGKESIVLAFPLKAQDKVLGVMRLSGERLTSADTQALLLLESIAEDIANHIARLQSLVVSNPTRQTETATGALSPAMPLTQVALATDVRALFERVYHGLAGLMVCDRFSIALDEQIVYQIENGMELPSAPISYEREMITFIKRQRSGIIVSDQDREARFKILRDANSQSIKSLVAVPLLLNGNALGILSVQSYRAKSFSDVELKILTLIAELIVMVLQQTRK